MKPLLAVLMLLFAAGGAEQKHRYIFVYTVGVQYYGGALNYAACANCYHSDERHKWYESLPEALKGMNELSRPTLSSWATPAGSGTVTLAHQSDFYAWTPDTFEKVVGLYEVGSVPITLVQVGTEHHEVQKFVDEEIPKMEWQVKP